MTPFFADAIFWIAVVACVVAQIGILRATVAERRAAPSAAAVASHRSSTRAEEIVWMVLPVVVLALVLLLTWRALHPAVSAATLTGSAA